MANWARRRLGLFFGTVEKAIGSVIFLQNWPSPKITRGVKNYKKGKEVLDWVSRAPFALLYLEKFVQISCTMMVLVVVETTTDPVDSQKIDG